MKHFKCLFIFFLTLSFSAIMSTLLVDSKVNEILLSESNIVAINFDKQYNNTFIDLPNDNVLEVFCENEKSIFLTEKDINLMAQIVYAESKGEPYEGKVAVASVILNRVLNPSFPNTVEGVIFQPNAFSCVVNGKINVEANTECFNAVYDAIKGNDPTNEALFFYNPEIATCTWMQNIEKTDSKSIGQHLFFKTN